MSGVGPRFWLCGILLVTLSASIISGLVSHGSPGLQRSVYGIVAWPIYLLIYAWMKADAQVRGSVPPPGAIPLIPVLPPIAVLYYLLATRPRWRKILAVLLLLAYVGIVAVLLNLGEFVGRWLAT